MIDFKYHITSLVAIFLALAIGILVGSTMVGGDMLVEQQKLMVDQLEEDFRIFRDQNRALREELSASRIVSDLYQTYAQEIMPAMVAGRLEGMKLAIIITGREDMPHGLMDTLGLAGSKIYYYVSLESLEHTEVTAAYIIKQLDQLDGAVLFLGSGNQRISPAEYKLITSRLISSLRENNPNIIILGTETSYDPISSLEHLNGFHIAGTIDNIETIIGQTALVLTLTGLPGNYGVKSTAQQLLPKLVAP
ncbi:MAG: copper transporter [Clostridia bacterium]|jgi:hypothetical protein|nr:copper transporter [Clostridia bacterium]